MPWWAFEQTPTWVRAIGGLVRRDQLRLILDLNLVLTDTPRIAAEWARAAETELPRKSIVGFEVGNEPDLYARRYWLASSGHSRHGADILPRALTAGICTRDFRSYSQALATIAPRVPPSELPARCAVSNPASSIARSTASAIAAASG